MKGREKLVIETHYANDPGCVLSKTKFPRYGMYIVLTFSKLNVQAEKPLRHLNYAKWF